MKLLNSACLLVLLPLTLLFSCTIVKRTHLPGYHIERTGRIAASTGDENKAAAAIKIPSEIKPVRTVVFSEPLKLDTSSVSTSLPNEQITEISASEIVPAKAFSGLRKPLTRVQEHLQPLKERTVKKQAHKGPLDDVRKSLMTIFIIYAILLVLLMATGVILIALMESPVFGIILISIAALMLLFSAIGIVTNS